MSDRDSTSEVLPEEGLPAASDAPSPPTPCCARPEAGDPGGVGTEPVPEAAAAGASSVHAAFASIEQHGARVWSLARRFTTDGRAAQSALQAIYAALWERTDAADWSDERSVLAVARRVLLERRRPAGTPAELPPSGLPEADAQADLFSEGGRVRRALGALPPERRVAIELAVLQGWSYGQIAAAMELPVEEVAHHARVGLVELRERLHRTGERAGEHASA